MTEEQITVKLTDHDHEIGSLKHRVAEVEEDSAALARLETAMEVMATKQDAMRESVDRLTGKVDALEQTPARRWDGLVDKLIFAAAGAFIAWIAAGAPGM